MFPLMLALKDETQIRNDVGTFLRLVRENIMDDNLTKPAVTVVGDDKTLKAYKKENDASRLQMKQIIHGLELAISDIQSEIAELGSENEKKDLHDALQSQVTYYLGQMEKAKIEAGMQPKPASSPAVGQEAGNQGQYQNAVPPAPQHNQQQQGGRTGIGKRISRHVRTSRKLRERRRM